MSRRTKSRTSEPSTDAADATADGVPAELVAEGSGPVVDSAEAAAVAEAELACEAAAELAASAEPGDDGDVHDDGEAGGEAAALPTSAASLAPEQLKSLVEALVFASDKPMTLLRLRQLTRISDTARLEAALHELAADYGERGLVLQQVSGGWQFRTRTEWATWVQQLIAGRPVRLTRAQLETLAIVAYRQPITRPEIDDIRGVDSSATLRLLLERGLIRALGKKEEVGRPMLYGTTKDFLDFFSLGDLRELPTLREYSELSDESRRAVDDALSPATESPSGRSEPSELEQPHRPQPDDALEPVEALEPPPLVADLAPPEMGD